MNNITVNKSNRVLVALVAIALFAGLTAGTTVVHADGEYSDFGYSGYSDFGLSSVSSYSDFGSSWSGYDDFGTSQSAYNDFGTSMSGYSDFGYSSSGYDDFGTSQSAYNDFGTSVSGYDDFGRSTSAYDDFGYSQSAYDDFGRSTSAYDDFGRSTSAYDDFGRSTSAYDDFGRSTSAYDDFGYSTSMYDDQLRSRSYYDDVLMSRTYVDDTLLSRTVPGTVTTASGQTVGSGDVYSQAGSGSVQSYPNNVQQVYSQACQCYTSAPVQQQQVYSQACGCYQSVPSYGSSYAQSYMPYASNPMIAQQRPQTSYPSYPSYPQQPQYPQPQPQRPIPQQPSNYTSNYCTGGSCNTSIVDNSINGSFNDNSINGSFNTSTVYPATPQPIVSYQIPGYTYPTYNQGAYCVISASPTSISNGQASYLTWSSNGSSAWLSDGIGAVSANGTLAVRPNTTRTYTLTVNGVNGSTVCSTTITVGGTAPYVSLSQIPYTGFDAGVVGNTIYWAGLASLAAALAYLVLYFKGGAVLFAGSMLSGRSQIAHVSEVETEAEAPVHTEAPELPVHVEEPIALHTMKDTMSITRAVDGTPRIVISRA